MERKQCWGVPGGHFWAPGDRGEVGRSWGWGPGAEGTRWDWREWELHSRHQAARSWELLAPWGQPSQCCFASPQDEALAEALRCWHFPGMLSLPVTRAPSMEARACQGPRRGLVPPCPPNAGPGAAPRTPH